MSKSTDKPDYSANEGKKEDKKPASGEKATGPAMGNLPLTLKEDEIEVPPADENINSEKATGPAAGSMPLSTKEDKKHDALN